MAILEEDIPVVGRHGDLVFYILNGQNIVRVYVPTIDPASRTQRQMLGRLSWCNLQNAWKHVKLVAKEGLKECPNRRSYDAFTQLNAGQHPVYLTKELAMNHACIITDYKVSHGSLPTIETTVDEGIIVSDIALGDLVVSSETTVAQLSNAILENNPDFQSGDQLAIWVGHQRVEEGIPTVQPQHYRLTLDPNDTAAVDSTLIATHRGYLSLPAPIEGAAVWVHFRRTPDRLLASTQFLTVTNPLLLEHITEDAFKEAMKSYGVNESTSQRGDESTR